MSFVIPFSQERISLCSDRVLPQDGLRQEKAVQEILRRLEGQAGLILADEVGMGKTFVALGVAVSVALARPQEGPVVVMVPPSLKRKWPKDWSVFKEHCLRGPSQRTLEAGLADSGVAFMRLLDNPRDAIVFLTHGALNRSLTDEWVKLALIRRALLRRSTMEHVRRALPRFAGRLLRSQWVDRQSPGLWERLLDHPPTQWGRLLKAAGFEGAPDDPVPAPLIEAMEGLDLETVIHALEALPLHESAHIDERLRDGRHALSGALAGLWEEWQRKTQFRSPLLVFDEAHHLKNPNKLSSLFAEEGAHEDSEHVSKGPLAGVFSRMLFLTATPFQLGHHELISVLRKCEGITWDTPDAPESGRAGFSQAIDSLESALNDAQAAAIRLEQAWGRLKPAHLREDDGRDLSPQQWWRRLQEAPPTDGIAADVHRRYQQCFEKMREAEKQLRPWVIRHLKPKHLPVEDESIAPKRREVLIGASIREDRPLPGDRGLEVDGEALLPFLLAARAQVAFAVSATHGSSKRAVFAEGLASSYEAYLDTRQGRAEVDDADHDPVPDAAEEQGFGWYLAHLDGVLPEQDGELRARHPKVFQTINRAIDLWWKGEKSLLFCHYRATGRALRRYVSLRLEQEIFRRGGELLGIEDPGLAGQELDRIAAQFFDTEGRLRNQAQTSLEQIVDQYPTLTEEERARIVDIALRFLRTPSFLIRYFPLGTGDLATAFKEAFNRTDFSGLSFRRTVDEFCKFLAKRCISAERKEYLNALLTIQTGTFRRESTDPTDPTDDVRYLPNVRLANGEVQGDARRRLMLAFNAPFFPEILIASSVLAEGVDLHLECRFVIHHDLSWNPSTIEQRTGRIDRIGAKAERARKPIHVYLPFVTATQDEKMFRVVRDRERWFSVVMGEKYQVDELTTDKLAERIPLPEEAAKMLAFDLSVFKG